MFAFVGLGLFTWVPCYWLGRICVK